jgi:hypothetical protein
MFVLVTEFILKSSFKNLTYFSFETRPLISMSLIIPLIPFITKSKIMPEWIRILYRITYNFIFIKKFLFSVQKQNTVRENFVNYFLPWIKKIRKNYSIDTYTWNVVFIKIKLLILFLWMVFCFPWWLEILECVGFNHK